MGDYHRAGLHTATTCRPHITMEVEECCRLGSHQEPHSPAPCSHATRAPVPHRLPWPSAGGR